MEWNHHCITYDSTTVTYYINGSVAASQNKSLNTAVSSLFIGDGFDHRSDTPFNGTIDEVRCWKKVLSQEEIQNQIFRRLTAQEMSDTNLVVYWRFNEGSGSTTIDFSTRNNNGMLVNMDTTNAWVSSYVPLATGITDTLTNITAIWAAVDSNASSILSVRDSTISGNDAVIFGHNNGSLSFDSTDVPLNLGILQRLKRFWILEVYGSITGDLIIDTKDLNIIGGSTLRLLVDSNGVFADADTVSGVYNEADSVFIVSTLNLQHGYYYTLGALESHTAIGLKQDGYLLDTPKLFQNFPNPFNPTTNIKFVIGGLEWVTLEVYDLTGRIVKTLVNERKAAGTYTVQWDGTDEARQPVVSGVYWYRLKAGKRFMQTSKMLLLR